MTESLFDTISALSYQDDEGRGTSIYRGFSTSDYPHDGDLSAEKSPVYYHDSGKGCWSFCVREDRRSVPRMAVQSKIRELNDTGLAIELLDPSEKKILSEMARKELLESALPSSVLVHGVVCGSCVWIARKSSFSSGISDFLGLAFGRMDHVDIWGDDSGYAYSSSKILSRIVQSGPLVSDNCVISGLKLKGSAGRFTMDDVDSLQGVLGSLMDIHLSDEILEEVTAFIPSIRTTVHVDRLGVFRVDPRPSRGGLPHSRLLRRFRDCENAISIFKQSVSSLGD